MADPEKDWSPELEEDPIKIQKELLNLAKGAFAKADEIEKRAQERMKDLKSHSGCPPPGVAYRTSLPSLPKLCDVLVQCDCAWREVKRIASDAPDAIKARIFDQLLFSDFNEGKKENL